MPRGVQLRRGQLRHFQHRAVAQYECEHIVADYVQRCARSCCRSSVAVPTTLLLEMSDSCGPPLPWQLSLPDGAPAQVLEQVSSLTRTCSDSHHPRRHRRCGWRCRLSQRAHGTSRGWRVLCVSAATLASSRCTLDEATGSAPTMLAHRRRGGFAILRGSEMRSAARLMRDFIHIHRRASFENCRHDPIIA